MLNLHYFALTKFVLLRCFVLQFEEVHFLSLRFSFLIHVGMRLLFFAVGNIHTIFFRFCFLVIVALLILVFFMLILVTVMNLSLCFLCCLRVVIYIYINAIFTAGEFSFSFFFLTYYSLAMLFQGLCIDNSFLVPWPICWSSSLDRFKNGSAYLKSPGVYSFDWFLLHNLVSCSFLVLLRYSF